MDWSRELHDFEIMADLQAKDAEIARLRTVLEWAATILTADREGPGIAWRYMPDELRAALHGDWPAVRAAGVVLPGEEPPPSPPAGKRREEQG